MNTDFYQMIQPDGMYHAPSYTHAMRAGNTVYVAGQVARDENRRLIAPGDAEAQARVIFANLTRILHAAGVDWPNVVKMTTFLVDRADAPKVGAVRLAALGDHRPPHTGLIVAGLGEEGVRVEVEVIAVLPDR